MPGFLGLNLSSTALAAARRAMDVVGQNIANVNNPAYNRQRVGLRSANPITGEGTTQRLGAFHLGAGVVVDRIDRLHAAYLDGQLGSLNGQQGEAGLDSQVARQIEAIFVEPGDTGIQGRLARFFAAFDALAVNPGEPALRQNVATAGQLLSDGINDALQRLSVIRSDTVSQTQGLVTRTNTLTSQIAALSKRIQVAQGAGHQPNDLLDQRDALINEVTELTGALVTGRDKGEVVISIDGRAIVQGQIQQQVSFDSREPSFAIRLAGSGDALALRSSTLRGIQKAANETVPGLQQQLLSLRDQLTAAVNTQHRAGVDGLGKPGGDFFQVVNGRLLVNPAIQQDTRLIAAGFTANSGDGDNALKLADLRNADLGAGSSADALYNRLVSEVANLTRDSSDRVDRVEALQQQTRELQSAVSGVDLDQELTEMVTLQHIFSANARMLTAFDEMLSTLIQGTGVVGR